MKKAFCSMAVALLLLIGISVGDLGGLITPAGSGSIQPANHGMNH